MKIFINFNKREDPKILILLLGQYILNILVKIRKPTMLIKDTLGITA